MNHGFAENEEMESYKDVSSSVDGAHTLTVAVEGNIGSGKSTFLQYCAGKPNIAVFPEPVALWQNLRGMNLLQSFYTQLDRWALPFQIYAGVTVLNNYKQNTWHKIKLVERSLLSAQHIFLKHMTNTNTIDVTMGHIMDAWYDCALQDRSAKPNAIIYMRTNPSTAYSRTQNRARTAEETISLPYMQAIHDLHELWINGIQEAEMDPYDPIMPVFTIDANQSPADMCAEYDECLARTQLLASI